MIRRLARTRVPLLIACVASLCACRSTRSIIEIPLWNETPWRLQDVAHEGDGARLASNRLLLDALSDRSADTPRADERIRRALQVDPTNPWAYLVMAREQVTRGSAPEGLAALDQASALLRREGEIPPAVGVHFTGLRGVARLNMDDPEGAAQFLSEASRRAPDVWSDGRLDASELR